MGYYVRPMRPDDIPELVLIDKEAFPTQWPPTSFKRELSNRMAHYLVACPEEDDLPPIIQVANNSKSLLRRITSKLRDFLNIQRSEKDDPVPVRRIGGYAAFWMMADEAHLTSIAVGEGHRRQGIGELLLISAIDLAAKYNAVMMTLEVRVSNHAAQALYDKYGFLRVGNRHGYYSDDKEDALIMTTHPLSSMTYRTLFCRQKQEYVIRRGDIVAPRFREQLLGSHASRSSQESRVGYS